MEHTIEWAHIGVHLNLYLSCIFSKQQAENRDHRKMEYGIGIIAFNRPHYLERVLLSLKTSLDAAAQQPGAICLFIDGFISEETGSSIGDDSLGAESERIFRNLFPGGEVFTSRRNLGVAWNFDRAERYLFSVRQFDIGMFFEDDLVLSKSYIDVMLKLGEAAMKDARIGMFAAYGASPQTPLEIQRQKADTIAPMSHNWGFGLTHRFWRRRQHYVDQYLDALGRVDYHKKDTRRSQIHELQMRWGFEPTVISQDMAKVMATVLCDGVRITPFANRAQYIGELGLHSTPEKFKKMGFADTLLFDDEDETSLTISSERILSIFDTQKALLNYAPKKDPDPESRETTDPQPVASPRIDLLTQTEYEDLSELIASAPSKTIEGMRVHLFKAPDFWRVVRLSLDKRGDFALAGDLAIHSIYAFEYGRHHSHKMRIPVDRNGNQIPWMSYTAINFFKTIDFSGLQVLEFTSARPSIFFHQLGASVTSVVNDITHYEQNKNNVPDGFEYIYEQDILKYADAPKQSGRKFDIIIINGPKRYHCAVQALDALRDGGLIILGNSDWAPKTSRLLRDAGYIQVPMAGPAPIIPYITTTSVFLHRSTHLHQLDDHGAYRAPGSVIQTYADEA